MQMRQGAMVRVALAAFVLVVIAVILLSIYCKSFTLFLEANDGAIEACGTLFVAIFTFTLWAATQRLGELALAQGDAMERSIVEATKATEATNSIAKVTKENADLARSIFQKQMRAYVSVDVGQATYQDENLKFAAIPVITNTGYTPAKNVSHHIMAAILETHLRDDFIFEEFGQKNISDVTLNPRQSFTFNSVVRERHPEHEVDAIMKGEARRLYVWGVITYEDIFGDKWETRFCFNYVFVRNETDKKAVNVLPYIYRRHNSST